MLSRPILKFTCVLVNLFFILNGVLYADMRCAEQVDSMHQNMLAALVNVPEGNCDVPQSSESEQERYANIEDRMEKYVLTNDDVRLIHYIDSVLLSTTLPVAKQLELQLKQCFALRETRDLDRAISVGHAVLTAAQEHNLINLQSKALSNLAGSYSYAGLFDKAREWSDRSLAFARQHGVTEEIVRELKGLGYTRMNAGDFAGTRAAFSEILELSKDDLLGNNYAFAKGGLLSAHIFEGDFYSPAALKLLQEVTTLSERPEPFPSAHGRRDLLGILCNYYRKSERPQLALQYARAHLAHVRKFNSDTSEIVRFALTELYPVEAYAKDYEAAYNTLLRFQEIDQIMRQRVQANELAEASVKLDVYSHEVARQAAERNAVLEQQAKNERTRLIVVILILATFGIGGTLYANRRLYQDRKLIEQQKIAVTTALSEKEVLLREVHHRVKNNLQIISSLLQKQARISGDADAKKFAKEGQERIQSMALVHENLYQSEQLSGVNIKDYLVDLSANVQRGHDPVDIDIALDLKAEDEQIDLDTAIPVGLILNELLTNAYKYAFSGKKKGTIKVAFTKETNQYQLQISDDGVGLPPDHAERRSRSLGHNLVNGLVRQLDGNIQWFAGPTGGTTVKIEF